MKIKLLNDGGYGLNEVQFPVVVDCIGESEMFYFVSDDSMLKLCPSGDWYTTNDETPGWPFVIGTECEALE